jgi:hypothetical protein
MSSVLRARKSALFSKFEMFKEIVTKNGIYIPAERPSLIFICGANENEIIKNKQVRKPSKRRSRIIQFIGSKFKNSYSFLAESVVTNLKENSNQNIYSLEQQLLKLCDYVIIVLESNSSFCELGAFTADKELLNKIVVINNAKFIKEESFINMGPIDLVKKNQSSQDNILWYEMKEDADEDPIAITFYELEKILTKNIRRQRTKYVFELIKNKNGDKLIFPDKKECLLFLSDLIYLFGPIKTSEVIRLYKHIFGDKVDFNAVYAHLALLCSVNFIKLSDDKFYISQIEKCFFEYNEKMIVNLLSRSRVLSMKEKRL